MCKLLAMCIRLGIFMTCSWALGVPTPGAPMIPTPLKILNDIVICINDHHHNNMCVMNIQYHDRYIKKVNFNNETKIVRNL